MKGIILIGIITLILLAGCTTTSGTRYIGFNSSDIKQNAGHPYPDGLNFR